MSRLAILGARLVDPASGRDEIGDVLVENGKIAALGAGIFADGIPEGTENIEADGLVLAPGLIDMRVVTGEPGTEHKETLASAGRAAAAGGVTTMVVMPQTNPVIEDISLVDHIRRSGRENSPVNVLIAGALTKGLNAEEMTELGLMSDAGAVMFSNGDTPISDTRLMRRIMAYSSTFNALIAHRPMDPYLSQGSCAHESDYSSRLGLPAAPAVSERIIAERDIALAELTGGRTLLDLISSEETLPAIRRAKARDLEVAASVSINHLALNEMDIGDYRSFAKLDPPLRTENDRKALLNAIDDGTIDVIVSSHDPRPAGEKRRPFAEASAGAVGLEILLSAGLTLVADGQMDLMAFLAAVTCNPAALLGLEQGNLEEGAPADLILFDAGAPWLCDAEMLASKSKNTPFDGRHMQGKAVMTICNGKIVFERRTTAN
ncbi:MAG: dihydroorotase [Acidimicrobiales bacterium]|nr:dihydroorotase [Hyphomonadaceae bacterium]RZV42411.1 MAG: dihydroorotase [Acidimicrobiales bacterium]